MTMYKKILDIKHIIITIMLFVSLSGVLFASSPQPADPMATSDSTTLGRTATESIAGEHDKFKLDFDWDNIGITHTEYHIPITGYNIAFMGIAVVFASLIIITILFTLLGRTMLYLQAKRAQEAGGASSKNITSETVAYSDEINAAIAMALHLYFDEHHDEESGVLTINKIERRYSPWSSKIYNINQKPF